MPKKPYSRVYVEITNVCNRSCTFCPGTKRKKDKITVENMKYVCSAIAHLTDYVYLHVMGEPLVHDKIGDLIRAVNEYGLKCAITTNGTLLKSKGKEIVDAGVYKVSISVHSFEDGSREEYLDYITSVMDFADYASSSGVLTVLRLWNRGYDEGRNIDTVAILKERFSEPWSEGERGARLRHRLHLEYGDRFAWPDTDADIIGDDVFCYGLGDHFGVLCDGTVIPCCLDREGVINLGNIYEQNIDDILCSERAENIRDGFLHKQAREELCKKCGYARRFKI